MRLTGTVRTWNEDRGFGFIAPSHGGAELFLHISALPRDGTRPTVGETVTYELGRGKDGRPQANNVIRQAVGVATRRPETAQRLNYRSQPILSKLIGLALIIALGIYGYNQYQKRITKYSAETQPVTTPSEISTSPQLEPGNFRCDGRTYCSQMTSCTEAKYFLKNCPGTQMDGNNDGVPCEQQWCTSNFTK
jgi:cold shock CspA family protein